MITFKILNPACSKNKASLKILNSCFRNIIGLMDINMYQIGELNVYKKNNNLDKVFFDKTSLSDDHYKKYILISDRRTLASLFQSHYKI